MNNVMKRPMFMQAGGSVDPALQQAQQAEQAMASQAAPMGAAFADQMNMKLDNAETFKDVIDGMRGNEMPLEARYDELAGLVGEQDAMATPESVLALVQPTMMMTEQGAANSGVAQLMEQVVSASGVEDQTMEQGLGSLMAAGQQAPVNFNQGGPVQKFANGMEVAAFPVARGLLQQSGGNAQFYGPGLSQQQSRQLKELASPSAVPSLESIYEKSLPLYQKVLGTDSEKRKDMSKAQILLDISRRALAFAGGVNPDTGENMANKSLASQFALAAQTLPSTVSDQLSDIRKEDQAVKLAALQGAQDQYTTALESQLKNTAKMKQLEYERGTKQMELNAEAAKPVELEGNAKLIDPRDGRVIATGPGSPDYSPVRVRFSDGTFSEEVFNEKNPGDQQRLQALLENSPGSFPVSKDEAVVAPDFARKRSIIFNDPELRQKIANGTATVQEINKFEEAIREYTQPQTIVKTSAAGTEEIKKPANDLTIQTSKFLADHMPQLASEIFKKTGRYVEGRIVKFGLGREPEFLNNDVTEEIARKTDKIAYDLGIDVYDADTFVAPLEEEQVFPDLDYGKALGIPGKVNLIGNKLYDLLGSTSFDAEAQKAISYLRKFNLNLTMMAAETYPGSRPPVFYLEQFENLKLSLENLTFGNVEAYQSINTLIDVIKSDLVTMRRSAFGPVDEKTKQQAQIGIGVARETLAQAIIIRNGIEKGLGLNPQGVGADKASSNLDRFIKNNG